MNLTGKNIVIGISGGIAVYKICNVASALKKSGANVFVVMTKNATQFVTPLTFETLTGNRVVVDTFAREFEWDVHHISLAKKADLFVIAPATANIVGKLASGIADDFLTTTVMATKANVLVCPAMNTNMLHSKAYQENEQTLIKRGFLFLKSASGYLACGDVGEGRLPEPEVIVDKIQEILCPKQDFEGKTVLITTGSTRESIDPVRFITNHSSGKMGLALANAVFERGGKVILVAGAIKDKPMYPFDIENVITTQDMHDSVMRNVDKADYFIMAAAPSDYRVENYAKNKIKSQVLTLNLVKNVDIAQCVGKVKGNKKLVVFSAETENLIENAKGKRIKKNADMVVANDVTQQGAGFNVDTNIATLIGDDFMDELPIMSKRELADKILDRLITLK